MPSYTQYMRQMAVLDAKDDDIESWITVKGNHIPIKKGQSKEDAVKSFIEKKGGSGEKKAEPKYDPEFEVVRKNALANPNLYGGKYTQKSKAEAYKEYKSGKKEEKPADLEKRASAIGLKPGVKVQFADGTIKEVVGVRSDLVDLKNDGKVGAHTLYPLEKGIKNGEIKVLNGNETKAYNDKGLYQDALNELDDQIADKEKELENIQTFITENAGSGYFDIANETLQDAEFVKGQLNELKKKREKLAGSSGKKAPTPEIKPEKATPTNGTKERPYTWHTDAGHGWMEVPLSEVKELGIDVTEYSYKSGDKAFLEEDKDMGTFIEAYEKKYGQKPEFMQKYDGGDSPIRRMQRFKK